MSKNVDEKVRDFLDGVHGIIVVLEGLRNALEGGTSNNMSNDEIKEFVEAVRLKFGVKEFTEEQLERVLCLLRNAPPGQVENLSKDLEFFRNIQNFLKKKLN